jgi:hypothetical protein
MSQKNNTKSAGKVSGGPRVVAPAKAVASTEAAFKTPMLKAPEPPFASNIVKWCEEMKVHATNEQHGDNANMFVHPQFEFDYSANKPKPSALLEQMWTAVENRGRAMEDAKSQDELALKIAIATKADLSGFQGTVVEPLPFAAHELKLEEQEYNSSFKAWHETTTKLTTNRPLIWSLVITSCISAGSLKLIEVETEYQAMQRC